jgi:flavin reductase (DIM6/NTAB) family NADH-FMN oxidoreductase RutF
VIPRLPISIEQLSVQPYPLWDTQWLLLAAGDFAAGRFNVMTVSWGTIGVMWDKPVAQVVIRPHRYTFEFMEQYSTYTLSALPPAYHAVLDMLGTVSGRDGDKLADSKLTARPASVVAAPVFAEAELVIECRKLYWQDMAPDHFLDPGIARHYPRRDYHRIFYGEIVAVSGTPAYLRK